MKSFTSGKQIYRLSIFSTSGGNENFAHMLNQFRRIWFFSRSSVAKEKESTSFVFRVFLVNIPWTFSEKQFRRWISCLRNLLIFFSLLLCFTQNVDRDRSINQLLLVCSLFGFALILFYREANWAQTGLTKYQNCFDRSKTHTCL